MKPTSLHIPKCKNCTHSREMRNPGNQLQKIRVCKHSPPAVVAFPQGQGFAINSCFPIVSDDESCSQFEVADSAPHDQN